ncbi:MAG: peptidylprolyl isomerase [Aggregatilineales bacterium]
MSKRSQTTGLPKGKQKPVAAANVKKEAREHKSRAEREAQIQRWVIIGTIVTVAVVAVILVAAVVIELVVTPNQVVATVNDDTITVAQFQQRVRLERALLNQQINGYLALLTAQGLDPNQFTGQEPLRTWLSRVQIPDQLGNAVINDMVDDLLVRQEAAARGISVTEADVQAQINDFFGFDPETAGQPPTATPSPTVTPTPFVSPTPSPVPTSTPTPVPVAAEATDEPDAEATAAVEPTITPTPFPTVTPTATRTADEERAEFERRRDDFFAYLRSAARISNDDINTYFETRALRAALRDAVAGIEGNQALYVNARHILLETEADALDVLNALQQGDLFAELARSVSADTGSGAQGGELGWSPVASYVQPFAQAVTDADIGEIIGPVQSEFGWHIIQVRARELRPVSVAEADRLKEQEFTAWLQERRGAEDVAIEISTIWADNVPDDPVFIANF